MKVIVKHWGIVETEVEVDNKFNNLRRYNFDTTGKNDELMDELLESLLHEVPASIDEFFHVRAEDGEILTEF